MLMNNFDDIFDDPKYDYNPDINREVKKNIWQTLGTYRFVGQIVDVYLPAMVNVLVSFVGGKEAPPSDEPPSAGRRVDLPPPPGTRDSAPPTKGPGLPPNGDGPLR